MSARELSRSVSRVGIEEADWIDLPSHPRDDGEPLDIDVLFTTHEETLAALKSVQRLGVSACAQVNVRILYAVPYTLPLDKRAIPSGYVEAIVWALKRAVPMEMRVLVHLCRDPLWAARENLHPHSVVFIAGKSGWWPTGPRRLARKLRKDGHRVFFVESK
jgi:hypothetical protein